MDETYISPAVITSKRADEDMANIQARHADLVKGMAIQASRVAMLKQEHEMKEAEENSMRTKQDNENRTMQASSEKNRMDFDLKQRELALKERALTSE